MLVVAIEQEGSYADAYLAIASDPAAQLSDLILPGTCVVSDVPTELLVANRLTPANPGCPALLDPFGSYLAFDDGAMPHPNPPYPAPFAHAWLSDLRAANYVVLQAPLSDYFPWTAASIAWFHQNYRLVGHVSIPYPPLTVMVARLVPTNAVDQSGTDAFVYVNTALSRG